MSVPVVRPSQACAHGVAIASSRPWPNHLELQLLPNRHESWPRLGTLKLVVTTKSPQVATATKSSWLTIIAKPLRVVATARPPWARNLNTTSLRPRHHESWLSHFVLIAMSTLRSYPFLSLFLLSFLLFSFASFPFHCSSISTLDPFPFCIHPSG